MGSQILSIPELPGSSTGNATDVNTQSMQEGAGISTEDGGNSAQGALLPPEYRPGARAEGVNPNAESDVGTPSVADGDTSLSEGGFEAVQVDEAAVLREAMGERRTPEQAKRDRLLEQLRGGKQVTAKVRSQPQSKKVVAVDTSAIKKVADADAYILRADLRSD